MPPTTADHSEPDAELTVANGANNPHVGSVADAEANPNDWRIVTSFPQRHKGASVRQVVDALELAEKHQLPCAVSELRASLHEMTIDPQDHNLTNGKMILLGVTAGMITNFILRATRWGHK